MEAAPSPSLTNAPDPRVRAAHDPALMREIFERHLQPPAGPGYQVRECRVAAMRGRDGSRSTVQYDLRLAEPATGRSWDQVVTGVIYRKERARRVWESLRNAEPARQGATDGAALPPFAYVPDLDMLLQVFPHDYRLPALARLVGGPPPELVPPILAGFGTGTWRLEGWDAEPVRYRPTIQVTVRVSVRAGDAATGRVDERRVYAKVYRDAEKGSQGYRAQRDLHDRVAAGGARFAVAEPIVYADALRTLIQAEVPGTSLHTVLRQKGDPIPAVRTAARAVADFHQLDVAAPPRPRGDEVTRPLSSAQKRLRSVRPDLAREVAELVDAVAAGLDGVPPAPTHGDLKPNHILFDGDRVALIDFDDLGAGDPLLDVANLVAQLAQTRSGDRAEAAARAFVEEYFAHVPAAWRARLPRDRATSASTDGARSRRGGQ